MSPEEITKSVNEDLRHIAKGRDNNTQSILRNIYNSRRRHDLSVGKNKEETLAFCIEYVRKEFPSITISYDPEYFKL